MQFKINATATIRVPVTVFVNAENEAAIDWDQVKNDLAEEVPMVIERNNSIGCDIHPSDIDEEAPEAI